MVPLMLPWFATYWKTFAVTRLPAVLENTWCPLVSELLPTFDICCGGMLTELFWFFRLLWLFCVKLSKLLVLLKAWWFAYWSAACCWLPTGATPPWTFFSTADPTAACPDGWAPTLLGAIELGCFEYMITFKNPEADVFDFMP